MNNSTRFDAVTAGSAAFDADGRYTTTAYLHPLSNSQRIQSMSIRVEIGSQTAQLRLGCTQSDATGMTFSIRHIAAWVKQSDRDAFDEILNTVPGVSIQR